MTEAAGSRIGRLRKQAGITQEALAGQKILLRL